MNAPFRPPPGKADRLGKGLATAAAVRHAVELARELGLDPVGFEVAPGGSIRILGARAFPAAPKDEFEAWATSGKLD